MTEQSFKDKPDEYFIDYIVSIMKSMTKNGIQKLRGVVEAEMLQRQFDEVRDDSSGKD